MTTPSRPVVAHYDRPIPARLVVRLDSGEEWDATPKDHAKFGLGSPGDAYHRFETVLFAVLHDAGLVEREKHITDAQINPLRWLVEVATCFPHLIRHEESLRDWARIAVIEQTMRDSVTKAVVLDAIRSMPEGYRPEEVARELEQADFKVSDG